MEEEEKTTIELDFTAVPVENEIDKVEMLDLSKGIGNYIHRQTDDIGMDEKAREVYHSGKASFTFDETETIIAWVRQSNMPAFVRLAVVKYINGKQQTYGNN